MTRFLEYFGLFVVALGGLIGGLLLLPQIGVDPGISFGEVGRLVLALFVVAGGFAWYYFPALRNASDP